MGKAFCCRTQGKGCPPTAPPTTPGPATSLPYDCNAGYHGCYHCLLKQWSVSKLAWCCQHTVAHVLLAGACSACWMATSSRACSYAQQACHVDAKHSTFLTSCGACTGGGSMRCLLDGPIF